MSTSGWAVTRRTYFSPRKLLRKTLVQIQNSQHISRREMRVPKSIPDLNGGTAGLVVGLDVDVDGEMGVDVAHLVLETAGDTDHEVVDDGADSAESSNTLASTVVELDGDDILLGAAEGDGDVGQVLDELAAGTLDGHDAGLNVDLHC